MPLRIINSFRGNTLVAFIVVLLIAAGLFVGFTVLYFAPMMILF